ncbi:class I SAM-dependent methyltransferase [Roseospira goensis]|uniref:SAM-dependent methyltransferase n=1 Tax=Roseospira goensis TaxID=391922 RepID=A0A7W6S1N4_9PROT|nr:class I SAM-dependent methyltransferase [Roseospira goensis]MBB4287092.1 SAM-dependent methyltransferase [Roseospira goensis]
MARTPETAPVVREAAPGHIGGNVYDKYGSRNPIVRALMAGFLRDFDTLVARVAPSTVIEAGCGEGHLSARLLGRVAALTAFDVDAGCVGQARDRLAARADGTGAVRVVQADLTEDGAKGRGSELADLRADLVVCCEVLEHVPDPEAALKRLVAFSNRYLLLSVPREPLWRVLNMARLKYLPAFGNTPGHVQHWSSASFERLVARQARVLEVRRPVPWTMVLAERL